MIPALIQREHVEAAIDEIDRIGIPLGRRSRKFFVLRNDKPYPPKYVISVAFRIATGKELSPEKFSGGAEANNLLRKLGFPITDCGSAVAELPRRAPESSQAPERHSRSIKHNERCAECKRSLETLLAKLYGSVDRNAKLEIPTTPDRLDGSLASDTLRLIYARLQEKRGHSSFVRCKNLPSCDFYVPNPGFIVEFDESQHFTALRELTLSFYPHDMGFGFDREKWMRLCDELQKRDDHPPFRDEQRAWFDALRDFAPYIANLMPTIRLRAGEFEWCSLNPENTADVETCRQVLGEWANFWKLDFRPSISERPKLARIAVDGAWGGSTTAARKLISEICDQWPRGLHVRCLSTPGAFLRFPWPASVRHQADNRYPAESAMRQMDEEARPHLKRLLSNGLRGRLAQHSDYLSIGIDTHKDLISTTANYISRDHAELVYVIDLRTEKIHFTGKSYPTSAQEKGLLRVTNLDSHFVDLGGETAMVLGCHDLTIFNPRSDATVSVPWRLETKEKFKQQAQQHAPKFVLHHPHTTVKRSTWRNAWIRLRENFPSIESYVGTGCYSFRDDGWAKRDPLDVVLRETKRGDAVDIVVSMAKPLA